MKRVLTAVVLIPVVLLILFKAPAWLFGLFIVVVGLISTSEFLHIAEGHGLVPFRRLTLLWVGGVLLAAAATVTEMPRNSAMTLLWEAIQSLVPVFLAFPFLFLLRGMIRSDLRTVLPGAAVSTFAFAYTCLPFLLVMFLRWSYSSGAALLLYLLLVVWAGDIAAYYVGRSFGRRRLAPRISPQKSWEGAVASLVFSAVVGSLVLRHFLGVQDLLVRLSVAPAIGESYTVRFSGRNISIGLALLLSVGINVAAQLGDLVESMLKRGAGVKDSGNLLPGHGGLLDRIDALLFAAPVLWYYATFRLIPF
jgi:phosphatidate cytidylyltransferase